jgi:biotin carboxyl carrier protein
MTLDDIDRILTRLETTDITECVIEHDAETLRVRFDRTAASVLGVVHASATAVAVEPETVGVKTPATGFFRHAHPLVVSEPDSGCAVRCGQHLGYVELDSVFCAIVAPADGTPKAILIDEGELVGYGQTVVELSINRLEALCDGDD